MRTPAPHGMGAGRRRNLRPAFRDGCVSPAAGSDSVPAVGISPAGARLGYGKGFYDRLLALPGWGGAKRLALVHSLQLAAFPAGPLDIPMHGYATEKELIWL